MACQPPRERRMTYDWFDKLQAWWDYRDTPPVIECFVCGRQVPRVARSDHGLRHLTELQERG